MTRRTLMFALLLAVCLTGALAATALAAQRIAVSPASVRFNHLQTVTGTGWPVIEFCQRRVRLSLESAQNVFKIGTAEVRTNGGFSRRWRPRASRVGAGRWKLVVRMRCESGQDGSPIVVRRSKAIRIVR
jgi:hypothetical protein